MRTQILIIESEGNNFAQVVTKQGPFFSISIAENYILWVKKSTHEYLKIVQEVTIWGICFHL